MSSPEQNYLFIFAMRYPVFPVIELGYYSKLIFYHCHVIKVIVHDSFWDILGNLKIYQYILSNFKPPLYHEYLDNLDLEELAFKFIERYPSSHFSSP